MKAEKQKHLKNKPKHGNSEFKGSGFKVIAA
jgi:hypothetical protein